MDHVYNVEKGRKRKEHSLCDDVNIPAPKRGRPRKTTISIETRYPPVTCDVDEVTNARNYAALLKECEKNKPRKDVLLPLLKETLILQEFCDV